MKLVKEYLDEAIMPVKVQLYTVYIGETFNGVPGDSDEDLLKYYGLYAARYPNKTFNIIGTKKDIESFTEDYSEYNMEELEPINIDSTQIKEYIKKLEKAYVSTEHTSDYVDEGLLPVKTTYYKKQLIKGFGKNQDHDWAFIKLLKDYHISNIIVGKTLTGVVAIFIGTKPDLINMYIDVWRPSVAQGPNQNRQEHVDNIESKIKPANESDLKRHDIEEYYKEIYEHN